MKIFGATLLGAMLLAAGCSGEHEVVGQAEAIAEKACACKDVACASEITDDMKKLAENVGKAADDRVPEAQAQKLIASLKDAEECLRKLRKNVAEAP